ncbi:MAG: Trm112 family protein [Candidatus Methanomethylicaceae archaeon]
MKRRLLDILACPICKHYPLELTVFEEKEEIEEGLLVCKNCNRWYPIIESIPHMLPDDLREEKEDLIFLTKWKEKVPESVLKDGKPFH